MQGVDWLIRNLGVGGIRPLFSFLVWYPDLSFFGPAHRKTSHAHCTHQQPGLGAVHLQGRVGGRAELPQGLRHHRPQQGGRGMVAGRAEWPDRALSQQLCSGPGHPQKLRSHALWEWVHPPPYSSAFYPVTLSFSVSFSFPLSLCLPLSMSFPFCLSLSL